MDSDLYSERARTVLACRTSEELSELARSWGVEPEQLVEWRDRVQESLVSLLEPPSTPRDALGIRLHHVGMVASSQMQMKEITETLRLQPTRSGYLEKYRVENVFFRSPDGGAELQFMLQAKGMLANFNRGRGGLHHVAFSVPDLESAQARLIEEGLTFINPEPQVGIEGFRFNFVHPNLHGLNVEIIEDPQEAW